MPTLHGPFRRPAAHGLNPVRAGGICSGRTRWGLHPRPPHRSVRIPTPIIPPRDLTVFLWTARSNLFRASRRFNWYPAARSLGWVKTMKRRRFVWHMISFSTFLKMGISHFWKTEPNLVLNRQFAANQLATPVPPDSNRGSKCCGNAPGCCGDSAIG